MSIGELIEIGGSPNGAVFSDDGKYRYAIWRIWDNDLPVLMFVGLNASTANHYKNDPTITRVCGFARSFKCGGMFGANLYPYVTAYPKELWLNRPAEQDRINDIALDIMCQLSGIRLVAWGNEGAHAGRRPEQVLTILGEPVYCLRVNPSGEPSHPLYLPATSKLMPYKRSK